MQTQVQMPVETIFEQIIFQVFLFVVETGTEAGVRETERFKRFACASTPIRYPEISAAAQRLVREYPQFWSRYRGGDISITRESVTRSIAETKRACGEEKFRIIAAYLQALARSVACSATARENLKAIEEIITFNAPENQSTNSAPLLGLLRSGENGCANAIRSVTMPQPIAKWNGGKTALICAGVVQETSDVKTFFFRAPNPTFFDYKPGQFLTLELTVNGKVVRRSYTISSSPSRPLNLSITVKRDPKGLVSSWLHENIAVGSEVLASGPAGKFNIIDSPAERYLFISAGSGITPLMSMTRWLFDTQASGDIVFVHCARTPADIIFRAEIELMAIQNPALRPVYVCFDCPKGQTWTGYRGHLNMPLLQVIAPDYTERNTYVCGPPGFMQMVKDGLANSGYPMDRFSQESFGGAAEVQSKSKAPLRPTLVNNICTSPVSTAQPASLMAVRSHETTPGSSEKNGQAEISGTGGVEKVAALGAGSIVLTRSKKQFDTLPDETILQAAERQGIDLPSACRAGVCGSCKMKKVQGSVSMASQDALSPEDIKDGYILTCVGTACGRVVLEN